MLDYLAGLGVWNWFILGIVLLVLEILAPGTFMLWLGLSALVVGLLSLVVDLPWQLQLIAFAVFALVSLVVWRKLSPPGEPAPPEPILNRRAEAYVGRVFTLEKPIVDGAGSLRIDDSIWRVTGPDCPAGSRVKVTRADGGSLAVEPTSV
jgi:membrane protein implicated in regulation of membrane protease activity